MASYERVPDTWWEWIKYYMVSYFTLKTRI